MYTKKTRKAKCVTFGRCQKEIRRIFTNSGKITELKRPYNYNPNGMELNWSIVRLPADEFPVFISMVPLIRCAIAGIDTHLQTKLCCSGSEHALR